MTPSRFRFDRQVTLAVVVTVAIQAGGGLIWAGRASARIDDLQRRVDAQGETAERLARLEEQVSAMRVTLERLERRLETGEL
jgi:Tfp pilus assembly protein PilN